MTAQHHGGAPGDLGDGSSAGSAEGPHVFRLRALLALGGVEFDLLALLEAAVPAAGDGGEVHEYIRAAALDLDEAVSLLGVEPLHSALRHDCFLPVPTWVRETTRPTAAAGSRPGQPL